MTAFWKDDSSGPRNPVKAGWLFVAFVVVNEIRGIWAAWEGAKALGWI